MELAAFWQRAIRGDPEPVERIKPVPDLATIREVVARAADFLAARQAILLADRRRWWQRRNNLMRRA
jgi:hypothetical protein